MDFESHEITVDGIEHVATGPIRFRTEEVLRALLSGAGTLAVTARRP
ncbi:MAG: hypothetical protein ACHP7K_05810 [Actinomycetales bacterium]